ncbi:MEDS domain-containing protein [Alteribacter aurantiacus]|uniref:MEDS domain-containing protein n=1 Tax=Alteribacter aurantiacus TaxID=254410 RepID=UPI000413680E|nr:MEDS domain-containing protein [Alteribacter aurantiacus]
MDKDIVLELKRMHKSSGGHIFYRFEDLEAYLSNAVTFIKTGVQAGDDVAVVESEKMLPLLKDRLRNDLTDEEYEHIHFVNNFQFYLLNGTYNPPQVEQYLGKMIEPYESEDTKLRTWANVEWGDDNEILHQVADQEEKADKILKEWNMISLCAYESSRLTDEIEERLKNCHSYFMTDETFKASEVYGQVK